MKTNKKKSMFRSTVAAVSTLALLMLSMASCGSSDNGADSSQASSKVSSTAEVSSDLPASSEVSSVAKLPTSAAEADYTAKTLSAVENVDNIKMMGRYLKGNSSLSFDATGSGILFNAYCEGDVSLNLTVSTSGNEDERFHSYYFTVYVDGKITQDRAKVTGRCRVVGCHRTQKGTAQIRDIPPERKLAGKHQLQLNQDERSVGRASR